MGVLSRNIKNQKGAPEDTMDSHHCALGKSVQPHITAFPVFPTNSIRRPLTTACLIFFFFFISLRTLSSVGPPQTLKFKIRPVKNRSASSIMEGKPNKSPFLLYKKIKKISRNPITIINNGQSPNMTHEGEAVFFFYFRRRHTSLFSKE